MFLTASESIKVSRMTPRVLCLCLAFACIGVDAAYAVDPSRPISQYAHTAWRLDDGFFRGEPTAIAQTVDGYLWIGTRAGLLRFDGVRLMPWSPPDGKQLLSSEVSSLLAARDGSLWIGTGGGLSHWVNHELVNYSGAPGVISAIVESRDSRVWFSRFFFSDTSASLCRVEGRDAHCFGEADGIPTVGGGPLIEDDLGHLWTGDPLHLMRWTPGSRPFVYEPTGLKANQWVNGVQALAPTPDGPLWVGMELAGPGLGLQQLVDGHWKSFVAAGFDGSAVAVSALLIDHEGSLWVGTPDHGVYRIAGDRVDHFSSGNGLSGDNVLAIYEDREGNLWLATSRGLDSFHDLIVATLSTPTGAAEEADAVLAARNGTVWVGRPQSLDAIRHDAVSSIQTRKGLPGNQITSLFEDHAGLLWVGIDNTLTTYQNSRFRPITRSKGRPIGLVVGITEDTEHDIWAETIGPPRTLFRIRDFKIVEELPEPAMPAARRVVADPQGGIWLGLLSGDLVRYRSGAIDTFSFPHGSAPLVRNLIANHDGSLLGTTSSGVIAWRGGRTQMLTTRNGLPCDNAFTLIVNSQGDLWLSTECGLVQIARSQLERWWDKPDVTVQTTVFDAFDGARPGYAPFTSAAETADGRLWFVNGIVLQMIDPARTARNRVPPPVQIEELTADRIHYAPQRDVELPALTRDIQIDYTGLSFVAPQKVRFRYQLEGHDAGWQDSGTRRQAFYNDLRPGHYRFRVTAANNDGVWNDTGATLDFNITPAWYQTATFRALFACTLLCGVWLLYQFRVRQIAAAASARFDERLAERTRIARDLHDTLVQTIQGSKLVADDALEQPNDLVRMRHTMEQLSIWLGQAMEEGRAALNSLRSSATNTNDLAAALQRATEDGLLPSSIAATFSVIGHAREMHPIVRDEIYRIGYEAIRNAGLHSRASHLEVCIRYVDDLTLRVSDDGIGIDPGVVEHGAPGHFGLTGMRERADRIGGTLTFVSSPGRGTQMTLVVPGEIVFRSVDRH